MSVMCLSLFAKLYEPRTTLNAMSNPQITTHFKSIPSPIPSSPSFHFHLTKLTNTLMIWVGTAPPSQDSMSVDAPEEVRLSDEWAAAWSNVSFSLWERRGKLTR